MRVLSPLLLTAFLVGPAHLAHPDRLAAQERPPRAAPSPQLRIPPPSPGAGWLGVQLGAMSTAVPGRPEGPVELVVQGVIPGSPAEAGGLRPGDRVTHFHGEPADPAALARLSSSLRPGDTVRLRVLRNGRAEEITLEAAERPDFVFRREDGQTVAFFSDSLRARVRMQVDSIRIHSDLMRMRSDSMRMRSDSIRMRSDSVRMQSDSIRMQSDSMRFLMWGPSGPDGRGGRIVVRGSPSLGLAGLRAVAGAELTPMNPGLARYFGVEEGILVTEVLEGTPAHEAGLRPGDVVVEVAGEAVRTIPELRREMVRGYEAPPVTVRVIRDGGTLTLRFGR